MPSHQTMTLEEARELLGLGQTSQPQGNPRRLSPGGATLAPDRAPASREAEYRDRMQQVNIAYQRIVQFIEEYRFELVEQSSPADLMKWWHNRFATGVWSPPPPQGSGKDQD